MDSVPVGAKIRLSVALLRQMYDMSEEHRSELVELAEVREEPDGTVVLVLKKGA